MAQAGLNLRHDIVASLFFSDFDSVFTTEEEPDVIDNDEWEEMEKAIKIVSFRSFRKKCFG